VLRVESVAAPVTPLAVVVADDVLGLIAGVGDEALGLEEVLGLVEALGLIVVVAE
jgi:hypothetical protein